MAEEDQPILPTLVEEDPALLRRTEEGYPFFQAEPDTPVGDDPFAKSAERIRRSVSPQPRPDWSQNLEKGGEDFSKAFKESFSKAPGEAIKSIDESLSGYYVPEGAVRYRDDNQYEDAEGNILPKTRKPTILPVTKDPTTGEFQGAFPSILDVANTLGSPAGTLGAGPTLRRAVPGMGHNQGPPMGAPPPPLGPAVPPPPTAAPPPMAPVSPRQIVRGHSEEAPTDWYTQTIDNLHPLKRLQDTVAEHGALQPGEEFYELARLTRGSHGRTMQALENGTYDFNTLANNGPALRKVLEPVVKDLEGFEDFAVAMRDIELLQRGINPGVTLAEAQSVIAGAPANFAPALRRLHDYQNRVFQQLVDSGLVSQQAAQAMRRANQLYVPFNRVMDAKELPGSSSRNLKTRNPTYRIRGSSRDLLSPLETIIRNTHYYIDLAEKNRALNAFVDSVQSRGIPGILEPVAPGTHPVSVTKQEVERFFNMHGVPVPPALAAAPDQFAIFRPNALNPAHNEIAVYKNGKKHLFKVDPEVAAAINGMGATQVHGVVNAMSLPARALRAGVVLAPEFLGKNLLRDQLVATVFSEHGYLPVLDYIRGLGHFMGGTNTYQKWLKSGGANSALVNMDRKYLQEQMQSMINTGWYQALKEAVKHPLRPLEMLQEIGEQPTRIAEFARSQARGKTPHQGGYASREITTDFARRGANEFLQGLFRTTAFANPTLQGTDRFARALKQNPTGTLFKATAAITFPTLVAYALNRRDRRIFDIPRAERDTFWHIMRDDWQPITPEQAAKIPDRYKKLEGGQNYVNLGVPVRIPKPFELGVLFGSSAERVLDKYFMEHPEAFKRFTKSVMSSFLPSFMPQIALPVIEGTTNYNFFRERPIVPKHLQSPENRKFEFTPFTTETAKFLGSIISHSLPENAVFNPKESQISSPMVIENYIRAWSGTLGTYTLNVADAAIKEGQRIAGKKVPESPDWTEADYPIWKAFVSRLPASYATPITDFYENIENSRTTKALINRVAKSPAFSQEDKQLTRQEILSERSAIPMARASVAMSNQMKVVQKIIADPVMKGEEKTRLIQLLTLGMMKTADHANAMYNKDKERRRQQAQPVQ